MYFEVLHLLFKPCN